MSEYRESEAEEAKVALREGIIMAKRIAMEYGRLLRRGARGSPPAQSPAGGMAGRIDRQAV